MPVYKDKNGTWYAMVRYEDWQQGERKQKCKRGFVTKREAQNWERRFLLQANSDLDMLFKDFYKLYERNALKARLDAVSSELADYKKKEEDRRHFSRDKLKAESKRISREEELSRELKKVKAFISACGLSSDYQQFRYNSTIKSKNLE